MLTNWSTWAERVYRDLHSPPTWRALTIWLVDELYWRMRLTAGDPFYIEIRDPEKYWKESWAESWVKHYGMEGNCLIPKKW